MEIMQQRERWEKDYQSGRWDYLADTGETARYAVIRSLILRAPRPRRLLDVGCGEALLLRQVGPEEIDRYTGLDIAQAALDRAAPKRECDRFVCSTVEEFIPDEKWSIIVFNEVLYYTGDPVGQIQKYEKSLDPGGILIVSIFKKPRFWAYNNRCARRVKNLFLRGGYDILNAVEIKRIDGKGSWQIFAVRPAGPSGDGKEMA